MGGSCHDSLEGPTTLRSLAVTGLACVTNPGSSKEALLLQGNTPKRGHSPFETFLIEISSVLRWHPGWESGLGGPAFVSGSGQSGGQALGPGPTPQPNGLAVQVLAMARTFRAFADPRSARFKAGPGGRIQVMGIWMLRFAGAGGGRYSHFCLFGSPPLKIRWKKSFWAPHLSLNRSFGPQVALLLCRHPSCALPLYPVPGL